jgi:large subunit ribosomal protein L6
MSKIGKKSIYLPQISKIEIQKFSNGNLLWISGPNTTIFRYILYPFASSYWKFPSPMAKGTRNQYINTKLWSPAEIKFEWKNSEIFIKNSVIYSGQTFYKLWTERSKKKNNKYFGILHTQIQKAILSAVTGYKKYLLVRGVGYKFYNKKHYLSFQVGYSHKINITLPSDFKVKLNRKSTTVQFRNYNDNFLNSLISKIRNFKKPDVYKGKGLRYKRDSVLRKEGKKKKTF